jgi:hypothetical protein
MIFWQAVLGTELSSTVGTLIGHVNFGLAGLTFHDFEPFRSESALAGLYFSPKLALIYDSAFLWGWYLYAYLQV